MLAALHAEQARTAAPGSRRAGSGRPPAPAPGAAPGSAFSAAARADRSISNRKPFCAKNGAALRLLDRNGTNPSAATAAAPARRSPRRPVPASAHRSPRRSIRIAEMPSRTAASRCRHGMSVEMSLLMSVVMEKCVAAYHDDTTVSSNAAAMTGQAYCVQKSIARTTRAVIVFMGRQRNAMVSGRNARRVELAFEASRERQNGGTMFPVLPLALSIGRNPGIHATSVARSRPLMA